MPCYECECRVCGCRDQLFFPVGSDPEYGQPFRHRCRFCRRETEFLRVLTRKTATELRRQSEEKKLRRHIAELCRDYGWRCRFLYRSVIISTTEADWSFDYHQNRITLYHESRQRFNSEAQFPATSHIQFSDKKISLPDLLAYIAAHDRWRGQQQQAQSRAK